jgi:hypothetical protein
MVYKKLNIKVQHMIFSYFLIHPHYLCFLFARMGLVHRDVNLYVGGKTIDKVEIASLFTSGCQPTIHLFSILY